MRWEIHHRRVRWRLLEPLTTGAAGLFRDVLELRLDSSLGCGWGEAAPLPGLQRESLAEVVAALPALRQGLALVEPQAGAREAVAGLEECLSARQVPPSLRWAAGWALAEALGWSAAHGAAAPASAGLLAGDPAAWPARVQAQRGTTVWKAKVGRFPPAREAAALLGLRLALGPRAELRLDANRAFSLMAAREFQRACGELAPRWIEEPLTDPAGLAAWVAGGGWPVALDESLTVDGPAVEPCVGAVAWVLKPQGLGLSRTLAAFDLAASLPAPPVCVVSSSFESPRGLIPLEQLARLAPGLPAPGLGTRTWFADDPAEEDTWSAA